jgi:hypothetical protein
MFGLVFSYRQGGPVRGMAIPPGCSLASLASPSPAQAIHRPTLFPPPLQMDPIHLFEVGNKKSTSLLGWGRPFKT